jgi:hypothetical protein
MFSLCFETKAVLLVLHFLSICSVCCICGRLAALRLHVYFEGQEDEDQRFHAHSVKHAPTRFAMMQL